MYWSKPCKYETDVEISINNHQLWRGPAQDIALVLILWYVLKIIYLS